MTKKYAVNVALRDSNEFCPQRLKPHVSQALCGTAEAVPLSTTSRFARLKHYIALRTIGYRADRAQFHPPVARSAQPFRTSGANALLKGMASAMPHADLNEERLQPLRSESKSRFLRCRYEMTNKG